MGNATLNEIHPGTYQHAADKARELGRYSQADNLEAGAGDACGAEYNEPNKVHATPKSIAYINGKYSCLLARDGSFSTRGANYFSDVSKTQGWIQNNVPEEMKTRDMALARKIVRWWNEYGEKDIPVLKDWHSFVNYNVYENMEKNTIRLNESQLRQIVAESVKKVLNEEMSDGVIDEGLEEMERILSSIVDTLNLNEYAPNGINGLDKERAISGIKSIKNGISTLYQATSNISSEY